MWTAGRWLKVKYLKFKVMFNIKAVIAKTSIIILATVSLLFAACSKNHDSGTAKVRIHVNDFSIEQESLPGTKGV